MVELAFVQNCPFGHMLKQKNTFTFWCVVIPGHSLFGAWSCVFVCKGMVFLSALMESVVCLLLTMQEEGILERIDGK